METPNGVVLELSQEHAERRVCWQVFAQTRQPIPLDKNKEDRKDILTIEIVNELDKRWMICLTM